MPEFPAGGQRTGRVWVKGREQFDLRAVSSLIGISSSRNKVEMVDQKGWRTVSEVRCEDRVGKKQETWEGLGDPR